MARSYTFATDVITAGSASLPTTGSLLCWWFPTFLKTDNLQHQLFRCYQASPLRLFDLVKYTDNKIYAGWYNNGVDGRLAILSTGYTLNQNAWNSVVLTWTNATATAFYLNGSLVTSNASAPTWSTATFVRNIGNDPQGVPLQADARGRIAEFAVLSRAITASEVVAFAGGVLPYRFGSVNQYLPLYGLQSPEPDFSGGGVSGTVSGTLQADHAPVTLFLSDLWRASAPLIGAATSGVTVTPAAINLTTAVQAPTVAAGATVAPAAVGLTAAVQPFSSVTGGATVTASAIAAVAAVQSPTVIGNSLTSPASVGIVAAVQSPAVSAGATTAPAGLNLTAAVQSATIAAGSTALPVTLSLITGTPAVSVTGASVVLPGTITAFISVQPPAVAAAAVVAVASAVPLILAVPVPTVGTVTGTTVVPEAIAVSLTVHDPVVTTGATATPAALAVAIGLVQPVMAAGAAISIPALGVVIAAQPPTITGFDATVTEGWQIELRSVVWPVEARPTFWPVDFRNTIWATAYRPATWTPDARPVQWGL